MRGSAPLLVAIAALASQGCWSRGAVFRARTLPAGQWEVEAGAEVNVDRQGPLWVGELGVSRGLSERLELGVRLSDAFLTVSPRFQLLRSQAADSGFDVLVAPGIGVMLPTFALPAGSQIVLIQVPIVAGWNRPGGAQWILAASADFLLHAGTDGLRPMPTLGVGYATAPAGFGRFMPYVAAGYWYGSPALTLGVRWMR